MKIDYENPRVSIIIPMFNDRRHIETCIDSILAQSLESFELILIDDCSTDGSLDLVQNRYDDPRIALYRNEQNVGVGMTMNLGIEAARGEFIYIMDHDDAILPHALEFLVKTAEKSRADVVHTTQHIRCLDENFSLQGGFRWEAFGEIEPIVGIQPRDFEKRFELIGERTHYPTWLNFFRRDFLQSRKIFAPETRIATDMFFLVAILNLAERIEKVDVPIYCWRNRNRNSLSHSNQDERARMFIGDLPKIFSYTRDLFSRSDLISPVTDARRIEIVAFLIQVLFDLYFRGETVSPKIFDALDATSYDRDCVRDFSKILWSFLKNN